MSKLTDDEIRRIELTVHGYTRQPLDVKKFARAIESAATEPLLQRIAELERQLEEARHALEGWANYGQWVWPESALETAKRNTAAALAMQKGQS